MNSKGFYVTAAVATAGALGAACCAYSIYKSRKPKLPTTWTEVGALKDLYAYPIKSCAPIVLQQAEISILGLKDGWMRDRILMVVDEKYNFVTARVNPELLLVQPAVRSSVLTLNHAQMEPLNVNLAEVVALQTPKPAVVWGVTVPVYDCGWEASEWFSRLLDRSSGHFRLVYYAAQESRSLKAHTNQIFKFTKNDTGALPDEVPYNLINEASVTELAGRVRADCRVTPRHFRPNFVLRGARAYDEDNWQFVKIGEHVFEIVKPCFRCVLTTIDPETGIRNEKAEPLETLKTYRQIDEPAARRSAGSSPRMGLQMALRSSPGGIIKIHDRVYVA